MSRFEDDDRGYFLRVHGQGPRIRAPVPDLLVSEASAPLAMGDLVVVRPAEKHSILDGWFGALFGQLVLVRNVGDDVLFEQPNEDRPLMVRIDDIEIVCRWARNFRYRRLDGTPGLSWPDLMPVIRSVWGRSGFCFLGDQRAAGQWCGVAAMPQPMAVVRSDDLEAFQSPPPHRRVFFLPANGLASVELQQTAVDRGWAIVNVPGHKWLENALKAPRA